MNFAQFDARMQKRAGVAREAMLGAHRELYRASREDHALLTGGSTSSRQLRQMGHPFAKQRGGAGRMNPLPINRQSGGLRRSFFQSAEQGALRAVGMGFRAPYAGSVLSPRGTSRMVARGFYSFDGGPGALIRRHLARKDQVLGTVRRKIIFLS